MVRDRVRLGVALVAMILAFLITQQVMTEADLAKVATVREGDILSQLVTAAVNQNAALSRRIQADKAQLASIPSSIRIPPSRGIASAAGLTALYGSGVVVQLADATRPVFPNEPPDDMLVHDQYVLHVVSVLFAAGARAVSIDNQRYTAVTSIFCAGPTIRINGIPYGSPFTIRAVGPTAELVQALNRDPDISGWSQLVLLHYHAAKHVAIPAYALPLRFSIAKPANIGTSRL